jgi:hypothetical protein
MSIEKAAWGVTAVAIGTYVILSIVVVLGAFVAWVRFIAWCVQLARLWGWLP